VADTIRIKQNVSLKHRPNLGEEPSDVDLDAGAELTVLKTWADAWLAKDGDGRLFNVKKHQAEEA
jgi:hypothetical protein